MKPDFAEAIKFLRMQADRLNANARADKAHGDKDDEKAGHRRARNFNLAAQVLETEMEQMEKKTEDVSRKGAKDSKAGAV